jgi:hypothetical protein
MRTIFVLAGIMAFLVGFVVEFVVAKTLMEQFLATAMSMSGAGLVMVGFID